MDLDNRPTERRFHILGLIIAVQELGDRALGDIRWVSLYYALGFLPCAGLRKPLQEHSQSLLPRLQAKGTAEKYGEFLYGLATDLH